MSKRLTDEELLARDEAKVAKRRAKVEARKARTASADVRALERDLASIHRLQDRYSPVEYIKDVIVEIEDALKQARAEAFSVKDIAP